jgi:hypothetical protein
VSTGYLYLEPWVLVKFTIVNSLMSLSCYATSAANLSTSATEMAFNGNDAVGLFKTEFWLISLELLMVELQTLNWWNHPQKSDCNWPSTTFNKATQWDVFALDTCKTWSRAKEPKLLLMFLDAIVIYPNPSNGTFTINNQPNIFYRSTPIIGQKFSVQKTLPNLKLQFQILLEEPTWFASVPIRNQS